MQIYITDLAAYNAGKLIGAWVELPAEDIKEEIQNILNAGEFMLESDQTHEEVFITDSEGFPFEVSEYDNIEELNEIAESLYGLNHYDVKRYKALRDQGCDHSYAIDKYEDVDLYENTTLKELAEQFVEEGVFGDIPDAISNYIDYEAIAYDLRYDYTEVDGDVVRVH